MARLGKVVAFFQTTKTAIAMPSTASAIP